jgi:uncharacterized protein (DUF433 family)
VVLEKFGEIFLLDAVFFVTLRGENGCFFKKKATFEFQKKPKMYPKLNRITQNPLVMGGKPCIRGMRVTVGMVVGLVASGHSTAAILAAYPYLEADDVREALEYAAWRSQEIEINLAVA